GQAEADVAVAGAWPNPTLTVETATVTAHLLASASIPLPIFGQVGTKVDAARAAVDVARLDTAATRAEARWAATVAWVDLREAGERARVLGGAATDPGRTLGSGTPRVEPGRAPRSDAGRGAAQSARARAEAAAADAGVRAASARLALLVGAPPGTTLRAAGTAEFHGRAELADDHPALRRDRAAVGAAQSKVRAEQRQRVPVV